MDIVVRGRNLDVSQRFRDHVGDKLARVDRFGVPLTGIDVEVTREHNPRLAERAFEVELTCRGKGQVVRAEAFAADKYAALDVACERLNERLRRAADKRRAGRRVSLVSGPADVATSDAATPAAAPGAAAAEAPAAAEPAGPAAGADGVVYAEGPVVVREKVHEAGPMTVEQALEALELVGHDFFLFQDSATATPSVVYRRRGYSYGLIRLRDAAQGG